MAEPDYRRALEFLEQLPEQSRKDDTTLSLLGDLYARLGRGPEAARTFQQAISQSPDKDPNYLSLALIQLSSGEISAAEATLRQGLARTPNSGKLLWGMGILSVVQGRNDPAEEYFKKCTDLIPEFAHQPCSAGDFLLRHWTGWQGQGNPKSVPGTVTRRWAECKANPGNPGQHTRV